MSSFFAAALAQAQPAAPQANIMMQVLLFGGLFAFMYFIIIRPQRKRQKEHESLMSGLSKGDEVVLSSGMLGKISDIDEHYITVKAADNIELKFQKVAVHAVLPKGTLKLS